MKKRGILIGIIMVMIAMATQLVFLKRALIETIDYSTFLTVAENSDNVVIGKTKVMAMKGDLMYITDYIPSQSALHELTDKLKKNNIPYEYSNKESKSISQMLTSVIWIGVLLYIVYILSQQTRGIGLMGKSAFTIIDPSNISVSFEDVAGIEDVKTDINEIVQFMSDPIPFWEAGCELPRGTLLIGPPGTGKTMIAKAMAKESGCSFISTSGSNFVELYVGMGARRVRELFETARKNVPCIIFIDEIDAIAGKRGGSSSHDEREQTLNQILVEMDGLDESRNKGIFVLAATNLPDGLDPAILRPGRLNRKISIPLPNVAAREEILKSHSKNKNLADNFDVKSIAKGTVGFSGAELGDLINEAALLCFTNKENKISMEHIELAKDKIMMGSKGQIKMSPYEKELTAYHEVGHAVVGMMSDEHDPLYKISIVPRNTALGVTVFLPEDDNYSVSKTKLLSRIRTLYGGRAAEEFYFGENAITSGASNDIHVATSIARKMVCDWGMSSITIGQVDSSKQMYSPKQLEDIDAEVNSILKKCYSEALAIVMEHKTLIDTLSKKLIETENLDKNDINKVLLDLEYETI